MTALVLSTTFAGLGLAAAYAAVLFDTWGEYPLDDSPGNYLDSPYWVGMPKAAVYVTVALQVVALVGYVAWVTYVAQHTVTRPLLLANVCFLVSSAAWPFAAYPFVRNPPTLRHALVASLPLWSAAAGVLVLVVHTFEAQYTSPVPSLGILAVALVVVLADGVGWTAAAIFRALKHNTP